MKSNLLLITLIMFFAGYSRPAYGIEASYDQLITQNGVKVAEFSVSIKGESVRSESQMGGVDLVMLKTKDGTYSYRPSQNIALQVPDNDSRNFTDDIANYRTYLEENNAEKIGAENIHGQECQIYMFLEPETQQEAKVWLWEEKSFPVKIEVQSQEGVMSVEFKNIDFNSQLEESIFSLPQDTQIVDMASLQQQAMSAQQETPVSNPV